MRAWLSGASLVLLLSACGAAKTAPPESAAARGRALYTGLGCASCHSVDGSRLVGPTWKDLYGSEVRLDDGSTETADDSYLRESILQPSAKTVEDYPPGLMETVIKPGSVSDEQVASLIAYIKTLR